MFLNTKILIRYWNESASITYALKSPKREYSSTILVYGWIVNCTGLCISIIIPYLKSSIQVFIYRFSRYLQITRLSEQISNIFFKYWGQRDLYVMKVQSIMKINHFIWFTQYYYQFSKYFRSIIIFRFLFDFLSAGCY